MCGIAGLVCNAPDSTALVASMLAPIAHRGPDGSGVVSTGGVTLGHRRLAVLDVADRAAQPMVRGNVVLTYNGELYNYVELRDELRRLGHSFSSTSDTEVVLAAYLQWGAQCVHRFDGMWAFGLHDRNSAQLLLSRDRFGEKPLLIGSRAGALCFASEHRQLRAVGVGSEPNWNTVLEYLALGRQIDPAASYFEGIRSLPPATNAILDLRTGRLTTHRYYDVGQSQLFTGLPDADLQDTFEAEFRRSVATRLRSDVPVGALLSGGVDSSLIVCAAAAILRESGRRLPTITAVSADPRTDESAYARQVSQSADTDWLPVGVDVAASRAEWVSTTQALEQPTDPHLPMQMLVFKAARAHGLTVMLDGQGADESWQGYERYAFNAIGEFPLGQRVTFLRQSIDRQASTMAAWLAGYLYFGLPRVAAERNLRRVRALELPISRSWLAGRLEDSHNTRNRTAREMQLRELTGEQLVSLLRFMDRTAMSQSIEGRVPYVDHRLVELAVHASAQARFRDGWPKYPLRAMLTKFVGPDVAFRRGKIGFEGPLDSFDVTDPAVTAHVRGSAVLSELGLSGVDLTAQHPVIAWRIFALALWDDTVLQDRSKVD